MARPLKTGVDYFPLDVSIDDKIELLEAKYGLEGFAILIKLWQKTYKNGYYIDWNEDTELLFARKINSDINLVNSVVNECLKRDLFSKLMYEEHNILTSNGIQERYFKICQDAKRKNVKINNDFLLVNINDFKLTTDLIKITPELTKITTKKSTQSIEEYIKEDDNKEKSSSNVFKFYNKNFGLIVPYVAEEIGHFLDDGIEEALLIRTLEIAIENNITKWNYPKQILMDCISKNIKTLEQFQAKELGFKRKQNNETESKEGYLGKYKILV